MRGNGGQRSGRPTSCSPVKKSASRHEAGSAFSIMGGCVRDGSVLLGSGLFAEDQKGQNRHDDADRRNDDPLCTGFHTDHDEADQRSDQHHGPDQAAQEDQDPVDAVGGIVVRGHEFFGKDAEQRKDKDNNE